MHHVFGRVKVGLKHISIQGRFDVVDSKSAVTIMVTTRNLELQLPIGTEGQAHQLDIPTRLNLTDVRTRH